MTDLTILCKIQACINSANDIVQKMKVREWWEVTDHGVHQQGGVFFCEVCRNEIEIEGLTGAYFPVSKQNKKRSR